MTRTELLGEIEYEWRGVAMQISDFKVWLHRGRYAIDKRACAPKERISGKSAYEMGVEAALVRRMLEV